MIVCCERYREYVYTYLGWWWLEIVMAPLQCGCVFGRRRRRSWLTNLSYHKIDTRSPQRVSDLCAFSSLKYTPTIEFLFCFYYPLRKLAVEEKENSLLPPNIAVVTTNALEWVMHSLFRPSFNSQWSSIVYVPVRWNAMFLMNCVTIIYYRWGSMYARHMTRQHYFV